MRIHRTNSRDIIHTEQKKKRNTTLLLYCSEYLINFKKLKYTTHYLVIEDEYLPVFLRRPPTVLRMSHFCMLQCQKVLTNAVIH